MSRKARMTPCCGAGSMGRLGGQLSLGKAGGQEGHNHYPSAPLCPSTGLPPPCPVGLGGALETTRAATHGCTAELAAGPPACMHAGEGSSPRSSQQPQELPKRQAGRPLGTPRMG